MKIQLTEKQERIVAEEVRAGHFRNAEEVIDQALEALQQSKGSVTDVRGGSSKEAVKAMLEFAEQNRVRLDGISVKELIHTGHRL